MEVDDELLGGAAAKPVRLGATGQCDALGLELVVFGEFEVDWRCGAVQVPVLGEVEVAQLGAEHGEHDIFEVGVGAIVPFEGGGDETARC